MKFSGSYELNSSKKKVWENLNNIDVLKKCIDGCEEFLYIDNVFLYHIINFKPVPIVPLLSLMASINQSHSYTFVKV